jgi:hypothetical protein
MYTKSFLISLIVLSLTQAPAFAKRMPAPIAQPAIANGIKYVAPNQIGTKGTVRLNPKLETDVQ